MTRNAIAGVIAVGATALVTVAAFPPRPPPPP
jgi:hypothetical protein